MKKKFKLLKKFCKNNGLELLDEFNYNSYRTKSRSEVRDYDSISITELLSVFNDSGFNFVKKYYPDKLKEACSNGIRIHKIIEDYNVKKEDNDNEELKAYKLFVSEYNVVNKESEVTKTYKIKGLPVISGTIDDISIIDGKEYVIDYKCSNHISPKYMIQVTLYSIIYGVKKGALLLLKGNNYNFKIVKVKKYKKIALELLDYIEYIYKKGNANNLFNK